MHSMQHPPHMMKSEPGLTDAQYKQAQEELDAGKREGPTETWVYRSQAELENPDYEPSLRDGLDPAKLKMWRRQILKIVSSAGIVLKIPQWGIATAALLCYRFFACKSMMKNDRFVIATACLHLAAKMEEAPKHLHDVVRECRKIFLGAKRTQEHRKNEQEEIDKFKDEVLAAERAVLYTLGFQLQLSHPYRFLVRHANSLGLLHSAADPNGARSQHNHIFRNFMQNTWNFTNDSFKTTVCLQYQPEKVAAAALYLANVINTQMYGSKGDVMTLVHQLPECTGEETFYSYFQISMGELEDISNQVLGLYEEVKKAAPTQ